MISLIHIQETSSCFCLASCRQPTKLKWVVAAQLVSVQLSVQLFAGLGWYTPTGLPNSRPQFEWHHGMLFRTPGGISSCFLCQPKLAIFHRKLDHCHCWSFWPKRVFFHDIYQLKDATKGRSLQLQSHSGAIFLNVIFSKVSRHKLLITNK